ncbi:hypothetical protein PS2_038240 [Malus domestica]
MITVALFPLSMHFLRSLFRSWRAETASLWTKDRSPGPDRPNYLGTPSETHDHSCTVSGAFLPPKVLG